VYVIITEPGDMSAVTVISLGAGTVTVFTSPPGMHVKVYSPGKEEPG
jgi:hypothetical protein